MNNFLNLFSKKAKTAAEIDDMPANNIKESEIRYRRLFETAKDGILILDFETGNIVDANPFVINIIGCKLKEIIGMKLWEIGLFSNKEQSQKAFSKLKTNSYIRFEDMPIQKPNGQQIEVEFISNVYTENNVKVIQCNIRDISERKLNEKKQALTHKILLLLSSQNNWQLLIKNILVEIKDFTTMEAVGIRLKESGDYPYCETIGFPDDFGQKEKHLEYPKSKETRISDNSEINMSCMCGNIILKQVNPELSYFTKKGSFFSNKASEILVNKLEKDRLPSMCHLCFPLGYQSVALIPLYSDNEIIGLLQLNGKQPGLLSLELVEFFEEIGNTIGIAFNRVRNENKIKESESTLKQQNADYITLNKKYSSLIEDLTESLNQLQHTNNELFIAKAKAEESDRLKSNFLDNMSHEINTPMNSIIGFSELIKEPGLSNEKILDFVSIINSSCKQLSFIISDIIDVSKIEAGSITIHSELIDINNLLNELLTTYRKTVELKNMSLYYISDPSNTFVQLVSDSNRIKQVICNLLNNAIKFTKEGKIEFGFKVIDDYIEFFVKDTGIGIAPENLEAIFQLFWQVETADKFKFGGNGLGLSICKLLVEKLGGAISVNSVKGEGSTFIFTVPYAKEDKKKVDSPLTLETPVINKLNDKKILLVEDEKNSHFYFEEMLSDKNVEILHAWDGKEAVEKVKEHSDISLVLMDLKMPIMNGYEATRLIKQIRPMLPVIAQSALVLNHEMQLAYNAGCDDYLSKPIDRGLFAGLINKYLS